MATSTATALSATAAPRRVLRSRTRAALVAGIVAGPILAAVSFAQIPFRDGFDMTRHAFSFLLLGPGAGLQVVNYLVVGTLFLVSGYGLRRAVGGKLGVAGQVAATAEGLGLVVAGLFPPPPSFGYPAGAPVGAPAQLSTDAVLHGVGFIVGMLGSVALLLILAVHFRRVGDRRWAALGLVAAVASLTVPATSTQPFGTVLLYLVVTASWVATSALYYRVRATVH